MFLLGYDGMPRRVADYSPSAGFTTDNRLATAETFMIAAGILVFIWNLVVSNVPGPQFPLYMAGAELVANYPVSVITDGMGLNITVMSYNGHLDFGIVGDRYQLADVWCLIDWLGEALEELQPAGRRPGAAAPAPDRAAIGHPEDTPASAS